MPDLKNGLSTTDSAGNRAIDWDGVRAKLKANQEAIELSFETGSSKSKQVFAERAARMATRLKATGERDNITVMSFMIGKERYCLEVSDLAEILPFTGCTPVPGCPPEIKGVISVRGEFRCVIQLGHILGLHPDENQQGGGYILLLRHEGFAVGLYVDQVQQVEILDRAQFMNQESSEAGMVGQFVKGIYSNSLIFLDLPHVLSHNIFRGIA